ncbi:MAG: DUF433 domain-containing protein [Spirosoma sp.]|nr:DUF433 domain-containing protein [Spirosoma sp.]
MTASQIISIDLEIPGRNPAFRGTRVAIQTLFDYLETSSLDDFLAGYPSVNHEQVETLIALAGDLLNIT